MSSLVTEFLDRTRRGTQALVSAVQTVRTEPERAGYLAAGGLAAGARLLGRKRLATSLRLALPPLLAGAVVRSNGANRDQATLLAGLSAGWAGELEKARTPTVPSPAGIGGVAAQHLAYSLLLVERGARMPAGTVALRGSVWTAGVGLAAWRNRTLAPAATVAGLAVSTTSALAEDNTLQTGAVPRQGLDHGANLVLAAESLTLLRAAVFRKDNLAGRILDSGTTATAVIGNLLLIDGLVRS